MTTSIQETNGKKSDKKQYVAPKLTLYGDVADITLKVYGIQDHNKSGGNANGMGDKISFS